MQLSGIRSGWRCTVCRTMSSEKELLISKKCTGCLIVQWSKIEVDEDEGLPFRPTHIHKRMQSGSVIWCFRCGVYADKKSKGLTKACTGAPPRHRHRGGMEGQLRKLRHCIHPKTGVWLPKAIEMDPDVKVVPAASDVPDKAKPEGFYLYEPITPPPATASDSSSGPARWMELRARIRAKELAAMTGAGIEDGAGRDISQPLNPLTGSDVGGGVWDYLCLDGNQHPASVEHTRGAGACKGKYRIKVRGADCHGRACCEGT